MESSSTFPNASSSSVSSQQPTSLPYHCPKCRSEGGQTSFSSLPELRQHILKNHFGQDIPETLNIPSKTNKDIQPPYFMNRDYLTGGNNKGLSDPEQLAQVKKYLLLEAMKSSEQSREQIKHLNDAIKNKETILEDAEKKFSSLTRKNQSIEEEFDKMQRQNREIRNELEELKNKLLEKEKLLEEKNKQLTDQLNYVKSVEEKEILAKEKLEKSVQKIIERAETAEKNLQMIKQQQQQQQAPLPNNNLEQAQKNIELQNVLDSCNTASNAAYQHSTNPELVAKMLNQSDPKQQGNFPLAQIYLKNFLDRYNELKARDFAYNQTFNSLNLPPQPLPTNYSSQVSPSSGYYAPINQQQQALYSIPTQLDPKTDLPENDGSRIKPKKKTRSNLNDQNGGQINDDEDDYDDRGNRNNNNNNDLYSRRPRNKYNYNYADTNYQDRDFVDDRYKTRTKDQRRPQNRKFSYINDGDVINEVNSDLEDTVNQISI